MNHADTGVSFLSIGYFSFLLTYLPENDWDWHGLILKTTTRQLFCKHMVNLTNCFIFDFQLKTHKKRKKSWTDGMKNYTLNAI